MKPLAALVAALLPLIAPSLAVAGQVVPAQQLHVIDFESLPGMPIPPPFASPSVPAESSLTDQFKDLGILFGGSATEVTVRAFDVAGEEIASATRADVGGQTWTLSAPGMNRIILPASGGATGDIAFDDLRFAPVRAIPLPPALIPGALMLLAIIAARIRRKRQT